MAKHVAYQKGGTAGQIEFNMTPMIDVTFLLIIFFILAGQILSDELADLEVHRPHASQAIPSEEMKTPNRAIVNVVSRVGKDEDANPALAGRADRYEINRARFEVGNVERLADFLRSKRGASAKPEEFYVEIRADQRVNFADVEPVMRAAAEAEIVKMNLTALTAAGE